MDLIHEERADLRARAAALCIDFMAVVLPVALLVIVPGVFVPLDTRPWVVDALSLPALVVGVLYPFLGYAVFPNTYGRYVMGIRVRREWGGRAGPLEAVIRTLPVGLWPVEGYLISSSPSRQRLGDRWAGTVVERYRPRASGWLRLLPGLVAGAMCLVVLYGSLPHVIARTDIVRAALRHPELGYGVPERVAVVEDRGEVLFDLGAGNYQRVTLEHRGGRWVVRRVEPDVSPPAGPRLLITRGGNGVRFE